MTASRTSIPTDLVFEKPYRAPIVKIVPYSIPIYSMIKGIIQTTFDMCVFLGGFIQALKRRITTSHFFSPQWKLNVL